MIRIPGTVLLLVLSLVSLNLHGQIPQESSFSTEPLWRRALGGRIDAFPAQGPGGDVYVVADDRALHSLDPETGESNWIYRPGGKLRNLLLVSPDGTVYVQNDRQELFAVSPGGTGRWKLNMRFEPAALPAAAPDGRVIVPLVGGRLVCVSRHGRILWTRDESADASASPVVSRDGTTWIPLTDGRIIALDLFGETAAMARFPGAVSMLVLDGLDRIWAGGFNGRVAVYDPAGIGSSAGSDRLLEADSVLQPSTSRISSILTGMSGEALVFSADGVLAEYSPEGLKTAQTRVAVSGGAPSAAEDGTLFLPASDGSIRVLRTDGEELELRVNSVLAEPLLSAEGVLISGGGDWILYAWRSPLPGGGWRQFRGDSSRSGTFPSSRPVPDRMEARKDPGFYFREKAAVSDDVNDRMNLIRELESYPDGNSMRRELPWVDLILEDLVAVGTIRLVDPYDQPLQSHAVVRSRAYRLLARGEDFRARELLLRILAKEEDPSALASGFRALGSLGTDWDGASMRLMASRFREFSPAGEQLTVETARAMADLVRYNGDLSDPAGYSLMNALMASRVSEGARTEVMATLRAVASLQ